MTRRLQWTRRVRLCFILGALGAPCLSRDVGRYEYGCREREVERGLASSNGSD